MNKVTLIGRTTDEIELKSTNSGKSVCGFAIAVNRRGKDAGADFIRCVAWETTAQLLQRYVHKGDKVAVSGRLNTRTAEIDGKNRTITEVVIEDVEFLQEKKEEKPEAKEEELPF